MRKLVLLLLVCASAAAHAARFYEQAELDALLAPVAMYPDPLLSHLLAAASYPDQVADAARGSPAQPHWHPSVSALLPYPELLSRMAESPQWMLDLSQAYIHQQASVMLTVQQLRSRAQFYGHLPQPQPQVAYVHYYDPLVVFGPWWWPAHRPVFWRPWHSHRVFVPVQRHVHVPKLAHRPHVRVPEARRRPIVNSTPQLFHKPHTARQGPHRKPR